MSIVLHVGDVYPVLMAKKDPLFRIDRPGSLVYGSLLGGTIIYNMSNAAMVCGNVLHHMSAYARQPKMPQNR